MELEITIPEKLLLNYTDTGAGTPLFFFPGGGTTTSHYAPFLRQLEKHFRVIAVNYPGFEHVTAHNTPLDIDFYANCMTAVIRHFGFQENLVVAHSMGGGVTLAIDALFPRLINKAVLLAPMLRQFPSNSQELVTRAAISAAKLKNKEQLAKQFEIGALLKKTADSTPEIIKQLDMLTNRFNVPLEKAIFAEKIVILGAQDVIFPYHEQVDLLNRLSNVTIQTIDDAGHDLMFSHSEIVIPVIAEFFQHRV